ncbi:MAG TPA: hypothetical protein VIV84_08330 [Burkholderiaceae bacterium]
MIARYEDLRRQALGRFGAQAQGLALFMRRGMSAWMQAWSQCVASPPSSPSPSPSPASRQSPQTQEICPVQLHADVATLLANMVLFARQEAIT